jgi:cysteine-rich repeat protein
MLGPYCGDGIVQGPEECDWGDLNGTLDQGCSTFCRYVTWLP